MQKLEATPASVS